MSDNKEDIQLLYKYLSQMYGSDKAKELMLEHKSNLWGENGLAYSLGKRSIPFFCLYFLQDTFRVKENNNARELADFHYQIWNECENMIIDDEFDRLLLIEPRGSAKSTILNYGLTCYAHCYKESIYTLVAGSTELDAVQFVELVRDTFESNQYIKKAFGELVDKKNFTVNKLELELANGTKVQAISSSSSMRGKKYSVKGKQVRPSLIICDDYINRNDILTQEARDKKYQTFMSDVKYAGDEAVYRNGKKIKKATKIIVINTILHNDDLPSRLLKDKTFKHIKHKAVLVDDADELYNNGLWAEFKKIYFNNKLDDPVSYAKEFYFEHEKEMQYPVLWEDKWNCLDLAIEYYSDPISFKSELMNDADKIGERAFHQSKTLPKEEIEQQEYIKTIMCIDPAVETGAKNDYTAIIIGGKTHNQFRYVRKGIINKVKFDDYIDKVIELLKEYEDISAIWVEKNTYNSADVREIEKRIEKEPSLKARNITILNERQNKNKEAKIRAISGKVDSGFIIFNKDDTEFIEQVLAYQGQGFSKHDDAPDILAEFDRLVDEIQTIEPIKFYDRSLLF
ncbi:phage terminase large subunit [Brassicibacter mesophilus]|uniref:phage terminase large subunit n=1 Tax=Brassicibacter mesophilus TaxID=745119 RepID=UPI003D1E1B4A